MTQRERQRHRTEWSRNRQRDDLIDKMLGWMRDALVLRDQDEKTAREAQWLARIRGWPNARTMSGKAIGHFYGDAAEREE